MTLVETLTVTAVVAVLASIAAPSVQTAIESARRATCMQQTQALAGALGVYAASSSGWLPPGPIEQGEYGAWRDDPDRGSPTELYHAGRADDPTRSDLDGWYSAGLTWKLAYVDSPQTFYCPAAGRAGGITFAQGWPASTTGRNPDDGRTRVYWTYGYRGGMSSEAPGPLGPLNLMRAGAADEPVVADDPCRGRMWHDGGYAIGFADGHVGFAAFDEPPLSDGRLIAFWDLLPAALGGE